MSKRRIILKEEVKDMNNFESIMKRYKKAIRGWNRILRRSFTVDEINRMYTDWRYYQYE